MSQRKPTPKVEPKKTDKPAPKPPSAFEVARRNGRVG